MHSWGHDINYRLAQAELELRYRSENDPDKPPRRKPGDIYIVVGAIIGMIVGGILGGIAGYHLMGSLGAFYCAPGGLIPGGLVGTITGFFLKKWRNRKRRHE